MFDFNLTAAKIFQRRYIELPTKQSCDKIIKLISLTLPGENKKDTYTLMSAPISAAFTHIELEVCFVLLRRSKMKTSLFIYSIYKSGREFMPLSRLINYSSSLCKLRAMMMQSACHNLTVDFSTNVRTWTAGCSKAG